jgi:hypothetical protein
MAQISAYIRAKSSLQLMLLQFYYNSFLSMGEQPKRVDLLFFVSDCYSSKRRMLVLLLSLYMGDLLLLIFMLPSSVVLHSIIDY